MFSNLRRLKRKIKRRVSPLLLLVIVGIIDIALIVVLALIIKAVVAVTLA